MNQFWPFSKPGCSCAGMAAEKLAFTLSRANKIFTPVYDLEIHLLTSLLFLFALYNKIIEKMIATMLKESLDCKSQARHNIGFFICSAFCNSSTNSWSRQARSLVVYKWYWPACNGQGDNVNTICPILKSKTKYKFKTATWAGVWLQFCEW